MREVDDVQHAVDQREAERDQRIDGPGQEAVQHGLQDDLRREAHGSAGDGEDRLRVGEVAREDHLDVPALHLRVHRPPAWFWPLTKRVGP
jgi:hypothetical protein